MICAGGFGVGVICAVGFGAGVICAGSFCAVGFGGFVFCAVCFAWCPLILDVCGGGMRFVKKGRRIKYIDCAMWYGGFRDGVARDFEWFRGRHASWETRGAMCVVR